MGAYRGELLTNKIRDHVQKRYLSKSVRSLKFEKTSISNNAMIIAASTVVSEHLFEGDLYNAITRGR